MAPPFEKEEVRNVLGELKACKVGADDCAVAEMLMALLQSEEAIEELAGLISHYLNTERPSSGKY